MAEKKGKKRWIIVVIALIVVSALVIAGVAASSKNKEPQIAGKVEYITKRTIANSISGNGVIEAANSQDVTGGSYGVEVAEVNVEVGQTVEAGDVICVFDTEDIEERIKDLRERIKDMESDRASQNADYDQRVADANTNRQEQLATASNNLAAAQAELAEAEAELAARQQRYNDEVAAHEALGEEMPIADEASLRAQITSQEMVVDNTRSRIDSYQSQIDNINQQNNSIIEDSRRNYNEQVDSSIDALQEQIERYKEQKEDASIKAGMSGTVTAVNVKEG